MNRATKERGIKFATLQRESRPKGVIPLPPQVQFLELRKTLQINAFAGFFIFSVAQKTACLSTLNCPNRYPSCFWGNEVTIYRRSHTMR